MKYAKLLGKIFSVDEGAERIEWLFDKVMIMRVKVTGLNLVLSLALFCISFYAAWQLSATTNFFYSMWYEALGIDETIATYGPKNKYKSGF